MDRNASGRRPRTCVALTCAARMPTMVAGAGGSRPDDGALPRPRREPGHPLPGQVRRSVASGHLVRHEPRRLHRRALQQCPQAGDGHRGPQRRRRAARVGCPWPEVRIDEGIARVSRPAAGSCTGPTTHASNGDEASEGRHWAGISRGNASSLMSTRSKGVPARTDRSRRLQPGWTMSVSLERAVPRYPKQATCQAARVNGRWAGSVLEVELPRPEIVVQIAEEPVNEWRWRRHGSAHACEVSAPNSRSALSSGSEPAEP
jgi:hypothetical protein